MSLLDNIFKKKEETPENVKELVNLLTNLTSKDVQDLKDIASGKYRSVSVTEENEWLTTIDRVFNKSYNYGDNSPQTRKQLYNIYDEMDNEVSYISAALDILSDDATQTNEDGKILTVVSSSDKAKSITEEFLVDFDIEGRLPKWARVIAKYGDFFIKVSASSEETGGISKITDTVYPSDVERFDYDGELVAFSVTEGMTQENLCTPWDYVHFKHKGDITASSDNRSNSVVYTEDNESHDLTSSYGQSILRPAIKVYAQLRFVENMILLSRLTNSVRRNIFMINVGDVAPDKSFETIANYANLLKKNIDFNLENGVFNSQKKTIPYDEDIFIPVADPKNDVRIEQVGGDVNIEEQYDLEYLLNKLFSALKIPKAYLNYEQDLNARSTLIQLDIRYSRSVTSLQQTLRSGLLRLAYINLAFKGLDPNDVDLDIQLNPVSTIDEDAKRQETLSKVEVARSVWSVVSDINDKLSGGNSGGMASMFGAPPSPDNEESDKASIDLEYAAELVLKDYLGFSSSEVDRLFNRNEGTEESDDSSDNKESTKTIKFRIVKPYNPDISAPYPTNESKDNFKRLREQYLTKLNVKENINNQ